jgi:hypothetical protein
LPVDVGAVEPGQFLGSQVGADGDLLHLRPDAPRIGAVSRVAIQNAECSGERPFRLPRMTNNDMLVGVSFARTPVAEISAKADAIQELGWREDKRGDPWVVAYRKVLPEGEDPEAEIRAVMGDYWLTADDIRDLLASADSFDR